MKKCHCKQNASYCVTVSKHCYCMKVQLGAQKSVAVSGELLTCVTLSGETCTNFKFVMSTISRKQLLNCFARSVFSLLFGFPTWSRQIVSEGQGPEKVMNKYWKKEHVSRCCTADVSLRKSVNQLYNIQNMAKLVLFSTAWSWKLECLEPNEHARCSSRIAGARRVITEQESADGNNQS